MLSEKRQILLHICLIFTVKLYWFVGGEPNSIKNPIASFFNMLHAFTSGCRMNQDSLAADDSLSVIGALLQKVFIQICFLFLTHLIAVVVKEIQSSFTVCFVVNIMSIVTV